MEFCEECGSLMFPKYEKKNRKYALICKKCGNKVQPNARDLENYVLSYEINPLKREKIWVVKGKNSRNRKITQEDREAFEDIFEDDSGILLV